MLAELSDSLRKSCRRRWDVESMSVGGAELMADILTCVDKNTEGAITAKRSPNVIRHRRESIRVDVCLR